MEFNQLFEPFIEEWNLTESDIERASRLYALDNRTERNPSNLLLFLYAKGILAQKKSAIRTAEFNDLLDADSIELEKALERLHTIVLRGETPIRISIESESSSLFDDFVKKHQEWEKEKSFVVFRDHLKLKGKEHALVERFQKSGLCYMHACVVLQHYLVAMNNAEKMPMLNMTDYLKKFMPGHILYEHIWNDKGGDSWSFFRHILKERLNSEKWISLMDSALHAADLPDLLSTHGPALISGFSVTREFTGEDWQHIGRNNSERFEGLHAMILVGYRVEDGKNRYLLQNWWKSKPYVEVDAEYLESSEAILRFIKEPQMEMGDYPSNFDVLIECEPGLDASENFIPETH
jgi:hypothetical protein